MDNLILPPEVFENLKTASVPISEKKISPKKENNLKELLATKIDEHTLPTYGKVTKILTPAEKVRYNAIGAELFGNGQIVKKIQTDEQSKWWEKQGAAFADFMTRLRQKFLNLKKILHTSFLWDVFKRGAIIMLLLFLRARNWGITWENIKKIPHKISETFTYYLRKLEDVPKEYKHIGKLITYMKDTWQDFWKLIEETDWQSVRKKMTLEGISDLLDNTARAISNKIYDIISKLNPMSLLDKNVEEEETEMQARLLSSEDKWSMKMDMLNERIASMDELAYRRHGSALLRNEALISVLDEVGDIDTKTMVMFNGQKEEQITSIGDVVVNLSSAVDMQQQFLDARESIAGKVQEDIKTLRGMSSNKAMEEIITALEGKSKIISAEERQKIIELLGAEGNELQVLNALKQLQSMARKNISYTKTQQTAEVSEEIPEENDKQTLILQAIKDQRDAIQKSLDEADDAFSNLNGNILKIFKNEKSVKELISKRDETFPENFLQDVKKFIDEKFKQPKPVAVPDKGQETIEHYGDTNSLTTVTVIHTKKESSALNDIISTVRTHRAFISSHVENLQRTTDTMLKNRRLAI